MKDEKKATESLTIERLYAMKLHETIAVRDERGGALYDILAVPDGWLYTNLDGQNATCLVRRSAAKTQSIVARKKATKSILKDFLPLFQELYEDENIEHKHRKAHGYLLAIMRTLGLDEIVDTYYSIGD